MSLDIDLFGTQIVEFPESRTMTHNPVVYELDGLWNSLEKSQWSKMLGNRNFNCDVVLVSKLRIHFPSSSALTYRSKQDPSSIGISS